MTYFLLLLFLEVLMSMQNSAEWLSEKKKRRGRKRGGGRDGPRPTGKGRQQDNDHKVPVTTLTAYLS